MRPGIWEIILIVALVVILFGSAKIPGMMKNIANGINIFKKEVGGKGEKPGPESRRSASEGGKKANPMKADGKPTKAKSVKGKKKRKKK
ncbi:MAG: twin-arginine translocase TatA/TatE family subunit [Alphaproteobacteria bacterium]|nr:twin-arginine translocase TatA/TatE family subunit [Alphaproteobacteria bacterium]